MALNGREIVFVQGQSAPEIPSGEVFPTTTQAIANLAGGAGADPGREIPSGNLDIASTSDSWIGWNSSDLGDKEQIIPTSTASGQELTIADCTGDVETNGNIIISAQSGTINNVSNILITNNNDSRTIKDTVIGWRMK